MKMYSLIMILLLLGCKVNTNVLLRNESSKPVELSVQYRDSVAPKRMLYVYSYDSSQLRVVDSLSPHSLDSNMGMYTIDPAILVLIESGKNYYTQSYASVTLDSVELLKCETIMYYRNCDQYQKKLSTERLTTDDIIKTNMGSTLVFKYN